MCLNQNHQKGLSLNLYCSKDFRHCVFLSNFVFVLTTDDYMPKAKQKSNHLENNKSSLFAHHAIEVNGNRNGL